MIHHSRPPRAAYLGKHRMNDTSRFPAIPVLDVLPVDDHIVRAEDYPFALPAENDPVVLQLVEEEPAPVRRGVLGVLGLIWRGTASVCEWLFGVVTLVVGLAVLSALPVFNFLSLGYLLEAGGRIGRTGRLRDGFIGVRPAARVGGIFIGVYLLLLPLRLGSSYLLDAQLIAPSGLAASRWRVLLTVLTMLVVLRIVAACSRGGRLRYFLLPYLNSIWLIQRLWRGGYYTEARDAVWDFVMAMRLPYYFWLGARGFAGAVVWLAVPVSMLALGSKVPNVGFVIGIPGALLLAYVLTLLPFTQMHFAAQQRFGAFFEFRAVRQCFRRAPWAFAFALFCTLLFALPLYLLKIEMIPRETAALPSLVFVVFTFPARLLSGWAYGRSQRRQTPRHWFFRWTARLGMVPTAVVYVLIVFFTQYTSWHGIWSLYEQHAFLLPVPFVSM